MQVNKGNVAVLVAEIAAGRSLAGAAEAAGMSVRTAQRRLHEPAVALAVDEARTDMVRQAVGELTELRDVAFARLRDVLTGEHEIQYVLRAADLVLRHHVAYNNVGLYETVLFLEHQLVNLEQRVGADSGGPTR